LENPSRVPIGFALLGGSVCDFCVVVCSVMTGAP
jgi:hypothetical protein